ncbi:MAG: phage virion morphogenesis protein [Pseudomonadota bacterium]|nr:phage virion morphogenesis protein [Pseudomonadota bacterium]
MLKINFEGENAVSALLRIERTMAQPRVLLERLGMGLAEATMQRFPRGMSPGGQQWAPKSEITRRLYPRSGTRPLIGESKDLATTITHQVTGKAVHVGSRQKYAAIHQFGGVIKPKSARMLALGGYTRAKAHGTWAKSVTIPARPYLGIGPSEIEEINTIVRDWAAEMGFK